MKATAHEVSEWDAATWDALGYVPIAGPYSSKTRWMADRVMADLTAGHIPCVLVRVSDGIEVWRQKIGMRFSIDGRVQEIVAA